MDARRMPDRPVYLTGFMASGKSTVGPRLALALGVPFIDLDLEIVRRAGHSIPEIFAAEGEKGFRTAEREALRAVGASASVVSVGGGALVDVANLDFALGSGTVVYLHASADELAARLSHGRRLRPMLQDRSGARLTGDALRERIEELLDERRPFYERAHMTVQTTTRTVDQVVDEVMRRLRERE